ncbi:hypothetical protein [Spirosoma utsteinense]|uniref:Uncharacterized protein n=1 Tax=Spirosoma utsteinense TaxID=2585773 RepID=A0ABR6WDB5_9BACT|nr:hypothetical protein [Spirosoma utsteinense]MBC3794158.1 hypothetical protein [Spirosoma utsteinense]
MDDLKNEIMHVIVMAPATQPDKINVLNVNYLTSKLPIIHF